MPAAISSRSLDSKEILLHNRTVPTPFENRPYAAQRFRAVVAVARETNPFYRHWIDNPDDVPILPREMVAENNDEILNGHPATGTTSGSTGMPVRVSVSKELAAIQANDVKRYVQQLGGPRSVVLIREIRDHTGPNAIDLSTPIDDQVEFILKRRAEAGATAVTTYPSNAAMIARRITELGIDMSFIERFGLYAEMIEDHQLDAVRSAFPNAKIWSTYSSTEFGIIAARCVHSFDHHHIMAHRLGVELVDEDGRPAAPGERGRVIITDFLNRRSPLIRYDIGDYAVAGSCPCGRSRLPALTQILGKIRGALLHRDGRRVLCSSLIREIQGLPGIRQYQVIQEETERFEVKVVAAGNIDDGIREAFTHHFGYRPERIAITYVDSIPREPSGKYHMTISRV